MSLITDNICKKHDLDVDHLHGTLLILHSGRIRNLTSISVHCLESCVL